jgi:metal-responsive CopG/Arc/MetJ family transcriptional regulator
MANLSVRLPDDVENLLEKEAVLAHKSRSELVREAITEYVVQRERKRFMEEMVDEARRAYADSDIREEAQAISEEAVDDGLDAIIDEERAAGIDPDEKWWR